MKNKFFFILYLFLTIFITQKLYAENLNIKSKKIQINEKTGITIFNENVEAFDENENYISGNYGEYNKKKEILSLAGKVKLKTKEGYQITTENILVDNLAGIIQSNEKSVLTDLEGNKIKVEMFRYNRDNNIFSSIGEITVNDKNGNKYKFSEIYVD
ncbi:MAG: hypothetical protein CL687_02140 [Candidatus Pelagibacter sp.]|nr:hypothetical protein [Candidatus Pelagibacter sp.]